MNAKELIEALSNCDQTIEVRLLTLDGESPLYEVRECLPNGRYPNRHSGVVLLLGHDSL